MLSLKASTPLYNEIIITRDLKIDRFCRNIYYVEIFCEPRADRYGR